MKKILTMQDLSCVGKCSLTAALPVISAMGIANIGLAIIIFTIVVRLLMFPLTIKSTKSSKIQKYLQSLKVFSFAESLGGVESLATYPWTATQAPIPEEQRNATGATEDLIRLSIGIENVEDLKEDLRQAFEQA